MRIASAQPQDCWKHLTPTRGRFAGLSRLRMLGGGQLLGPLTSAPAGAGMLGSNRFGMKQIMICFIENHKDVETRLLGFPAICCKFRGHLVTLPNDSIDTRVRPIGLAGFPICRLCRLGVHSRATVLASREANLLQATICARACALIWAAEDDSNLWWQCWIHLLGAPGVTPPGQSCEQPTRSLTDMVERAQRDEVHSEKRAIAERLTSTGSADDNLQSHLPNCCCYCSLVPSRAQAR